MLEVSGVTFSYPHSPPLFKELSFSLKSPGLVVILGPNGSGKSTLARLLVGLLFPQRGRIEVLGKAPQEARSQIYLIFENPDSQFVGLTLWEDLLYSASRLPLEEREKACREALEKVRLSQKAHRFINELSGGEKELALIAGALAAKPSLLVSDESTTYLDPLLQERILKIFKELAQGSLVVHFTHRTEEILWADWVGVMSEGKLSWHRPFKLLGKLEVIEEKGLEVPSWLPLCSSLCKERGFKCRTLKELGKAICSTS